MCALVNVIDSFLPFCHSDSFVARINVIFPFVVAWKRARKVDNESLEGAYILALFFRGYHSASVDAVVFATYRFPCFSENLSGLPLCSFFNCIKNVNSLLDSRHDI